MYLVSSYLVSILGEGKKIAHPLKNQGWDTVKSSIPRFHPGCPAYAEPLIDAVTGAPGGTFPTRGSEVVTPAAGVRMPFTKSGILSGNLTGARVFVKAFLLRKFSTLFLKSQWPDTEKPVPKSPKNGGRTGCKVT